MPRRCRTLLALATTLLVGIVGCAGPAESPADLVLLGGRLVTLDPDRPEAEALAVKGTRIVAVGSDAEIGRLAGPATQRIDLEGRLTLPGFIEGHGHFTGIGRTKLVIDLAGARTWDEIVDLVAAAAAETPAGDWIIGWGWHQEKWDSPAVPAVEGYPVHDALSRVTPDHPVLLRHAAGSHAGLINARAMQLAGIDATTPDPPGGSILRDADGRPTGVLRENAYALANDAMEVWIAARPEAWREERARREVELATDECLSKGITTFQDAGALFHEMELFRELAEAGELRIRLWAMITEKAEVEELERRAAELRVIGAGDDHYTQRALKREIDGALGSHSAWLLAPYADMPDHAGLNTTPLADLERAARLAAALDLQVAVHAIGDRGNRETLDIYERVLGDLDDASDRRWRIEHAQHLDPADIPRFAELGVIAAMQGVHCTSDGPWVPQRLGAERSAGGAYVWRKLLDSGAVVINGTDAPVEDVDPIAGFYASVTRRMANGEAFYPGQRMTRLEALRSYTIDAAFAGFEEQIKGSLTPGKLADIVVLSRDILEIPDDEIPGTEVDYTLVGGDIRYRR